MLRESNEERAHPGQLGLAIFLLVSLEDFEASGVAAGPVRGRWNTFAHQDQINELFGEPSFSPIKTRKRAILRGHVRVAGGRAQGGNCSRLDLHDP